MVYLGRVVGIGKMEDRKPFVLYAVSGRSEESKQRKASIYESEGRVHIGPLDGSDSDLLRHYDAVQAGRNNSYIVVSNGSQTDGIASRCSKLMTRPGLRSNIQKSLDCMRAEPDACHTPRIAAIYTPNQHFSGFFGIRNYRRAAEAWELDLTEGMAFLLPTYKGDPNDPRAVIVSHADGNPAVDFNGKTAQQLADQLYDWVDRNLVVCTAAYAQEEWGKPWKFAVRNLHE